MLSAVLIVLGSFVLMRLSFPFEVNADVSMFLRCGQLLLEGQRPYVDFIEMNPPLIFYLSAIPCLIGKLAFGPVFWMYSIMCVFAIAVILLVARISRDCEDLEPMRFSILVSIAMSFLFQQYCGMTGQRDQIIGLCLTPWIFLRHASFTVASTFSMPAPLSFCAGILLGIAVCLKPYFLVVPVLVELFYLKDKRKWVWGFEHMGLVCVVLLFAAHFLFWPKECLDAFFGRWLPTVAQGYPAYNRPFMTAVVVGTLSGMFLIPLASIAVLIKHRMKSGFSLTLLLWILAVIAIYFYQGKGLISHLMSLMPPSVMLLSTGLSLWLSGRKFYNSMATGPWPQVWAVVLASSITLLLLSIAVVHKYLSKLQYNGADRQVILTETKKGDRILVFSASNDFAFPNLLLTDRQSSSRYLFEFPIGMYIWLEDTAPTAQEKAKWVREEQRYIDDLEEDIRRFRPKLVVMALPDEAIGDHSPTMDYLASRGDLWNKYFKDATFLGRYQGSFLKVGIWKPHWTDESDCGPK